MDNLLKIFFRNFRRYPVFSLINLGGLSIGIASSFLLLVYCQREMSVDRHFKDASRIVRVGTDFFHMGPFAVSQPMLHDVLIVSCKDIQYATSFNPNGADMPIRTGFNDRAFTGIDPYFIDQDFFKVFSYEAAAGTIPSRGLFPGETILSAGLARRVFGDTDPIGHSILAGKENIPYKVIAVLKENFSKSTLDPQILLPLTKDRSDNRNWMSAAIYNYAKLKTGGSVEGLRTSLERIREKVIFPASGAGSYEKWKESLMAVSFVVTPLTDIYFSSDMKFELSPGGNQAQVKLLSAISVLLIILAVINYVNLVTARSSTRVKEIGLKKTFGAPRSALIFQVIRESCLFSLFAMLLACGLIQVILFLYQKSTGAALTGPIPFLSANYVWLIIFSLSVGILAGVYPAWYLTGNRSRLTVRSTTGSGKNSPVIRNALVMLQFMIAASLVLSSIVVYTQIQYMKNKDMGFHTDGVVLVTNVNSLGPRATVFRQLVQQQAQVVDASFCNRTPGSTTLWMHSYRTATMPKAMSIQTFPVDDQFIPTLDVRLVNGRNFNKDLITDTNSLILNESAVAALGLFNPIGATINGSERVIGVIKDFNYASLHEKIAPAILRYANAGNTLAIRLRGSRNAAFLDWLRNTMQQWQPDVSLQLGFLDDNFARLAEKERLLSRAITFYTVLAILLATLGLIGLTLFTLERRTKEIGIRKVLGADASDILGMVSGSFVRIAMIASLIAFPLSGWLVNNWLRNFAYRVQVSPWAFVITEGLILAVAFSVICILTMKALASDPVKSLRSE
jgi:putative ABC transport system permease protein